MKKQSKQTKTQQTSSLDNTVQLLIPPSLVLLLVFTIIDLFYGFGKFAILIDIFDLYVIAIFAIDLHFRWKETKNIALFFDFDILLPSIPGIKLEWIIAGNL